MRLKQEQEEADGDSDHPRQSWRRWSRPGTWDVRDFVSSMTSRAASHASRAASATSDVEGRTRRARRGSRGSNASFGAQHPLEGGGIARSRRPSLSIGSVDQPRSGSPAMRPSIGSVDQPRSGSPAMRPSSSHASNNGASGRFFTEGLPANWHGEGPTPSSSGVEPQAS